MADQYDTFPYETCYQLTAAGRTYPVVTIAGPGPDAITHEVYRDLRKEFYQEQGAPDWHGALSGRDDEDYIRAFASWLIEKKGFRRLEPDEWLFYQ